MPAKPYDAYKAVVVGSSENTQDWSFGLWFQAAETLPTAPMMNAWANDLLAPTSILFNSIKGLMGADSNWYTMKTYYYPSGATKASVVGETPLVSPVAGTVSSPQSPLQVALVASLLTGLSGATHKGRMYFPCNAPLLATRQLSQSDTEALATATAAWLRACNLVTIGGEAAHAIVAGSAAATAVTSARVDSRLDIQRRRTDKIGAAFTTVIPL